MKINYITEAVFKNPSQAREAREKAGQLSNVERLAGTANKVVIEPIIRFLNDGLQAFLTGSHRHRYSVSYVQAHRNDPLSIAPDFMSSYCVFKDKDIFDIYYEYQTAKITNIDLQNKVIDVLVTLGQPHAGLYPGYYYSKKQHANNSDVAYATYYDKLNGMLNSSTVPFAHTTRSCYPGSNIRLLKGKITYILKNIESDYKEDINSQSDDIKKIIETIDYLQLLNEFEYNCKIEWNLTQDVIFFPILCEDDFDFSEAKGNKEEALEYIAHVYYPMVLEDSYSTKTYENKYGTAEITTASMITDIKKNHATKEEHHTLISRLKSLDMQGLAALYTESLKNLEIEIVGEGHLYLSTGYFKKNYLIA